VNKTLFAVTLLLAPSARAAETASFLDIGVGARALGMGGAYAAAADDSASLYWNPAGLARLEKKEVSASHAELPQSTRLDFLAYAHPTTQGTFAAGLTYLSHGKLEGRDALGRPAAGFDASDAAFAAAYARKLDRAELGASVKFLQSHIGSLQAQSVAVDAGARHAFGPLSVGAALRNLGPGLKYDGQRNDLPLRVAVGAAWKAQGGHLAAVELVNGPRGAGTGVGVGGEYKAVAGFALRAGYATQTAVTGGSGFDAARGLTLGLGWGDERWRLDYAVRPTGELGRSHLFSVGARW
jgi:hypothetical protein